MRRLPTILVALAAPGALLVLALAAPVAAPGSAPAALIRAVNAAAALVAGPAQAQERFDFQPVSPESARRLEERRAARRAEAARRSGAAEAPAAPAAPAPPPEPDAPPAPGERTRSGNIMRVGSDIEIEEEQTVVGDVLAVGGDIRVAGHVEGDVVAMGGDVHLAETARVDGDVVCMGGRLSEDDGAIVGGQRVTAAGRDRLKRIHIDADTHRRAGDVTGEMVWLILSLLLAWGLAGLAPGRTGAAMRTMREEAGPSALTGFVALMLSVPSIIAISLLAALLCITIIGIPLAIAGLFGWFAFLGLLFLWGYVVGAGVVGRTVLERQSARAGVPGGAGGAVPAGAPGAVAPAAEPGVLRSALIGMLVLAGAQFVGQLLHLIPGLGWLGTLLRVLAWIAFAFVTMVGAGAWLRNELRSGRLARLWRGRNGAGTAAAAPAGARQWYPGPRAPPAGGPGGAPPAPAGPAPAVPPADPGAPPPPGVPPAEPGRSG